MAEEVQSQTAPTELGTESIGALIKKYAVPGIIAMTASSLYNMVDSIYIGHIPESGSLAISGLAVTFPLMNLSTALGTLVGGGAATLVSVLLGQKNYKVASKVLVNELTLNCIFGIIFTVVCLAFLNPILYFFGASENTLPYASSYMKIILYGNVITHVYFGLNNLIRSSGNPKTAMAMTLFTVIFNAILDPIFIFGLGLGVQGAAWATVIAQTCACGYTLYYFSRKDNVIHFDGKYFGLDWRIAKDSLAIGMGPFLMNSASCIVTMLINQQLRKYGGDLAIGAYGIVNRINFFFLMIIMGFNQGMQPIAGYNYGARLYSRVKSVYFKTCMWATLVTTFWFIASECFPGVMVRIFTNDSELIQVADRGLRLMNPVVLIVGAQIVSTNLFQSLGMVKKSIFLSLSRQLLMLVPLIYFLPPLLGVDGVFLSFPIADALACATTLVMVIQLMRKFNKLNDGDSPEILGSTI